MWPGRSFPGVTMTRRSSTVGQQDLADASGEQFPETQWSLVLRARGPVEPAAQHALDMLCTAYWHPIYAFIRRKGSKPHEAYDLTQEYFFRLLKRGTLATVDPCKGRCRSFLRTDCSHFLIDQHRGKTADIRGGGRRILSIDARSAEGRYQHEPC